MIKSVKVVSELWGFSSTDDRIDRILNIERRIHVHVQIYLTNENNSKLNGVVYELILTYSLQIEWHFNHYLAN